VVGQPSWRFTTTLQHAYERACRAGIPEVGTDFVFYEVAMNLLALGLLRARCLRCGAQCGGDDRA
jgi:hypothetical protein